VDPEEAAETGTPKLVGRAGNGSHPLTPPLDQAAPSADPAQPGVSPLGRSPAGESPPGAPLVAGSPPGAPPVAGSPGAPPHTAPLVNGPAPTPPVGGSTPCQIAANELPQAGQ
jgi:hypothetical protein